MMATDESGNNSYHEFFELHPENYIWWGWLNEII